MKSDVIIVSHIFLSSWKYLVNNLLQNSWEFLMVNGGKKKHIELKKELPFVTYALGLPTKSVKGKMRKGVEILFKVTINVL